MVSPFPIPGGRVQHAYREMHLAANGTAEQQQALGNHELLPHPWEPATCLDPELRHQLWLWLDEVVIWLNHEYTWDLSGLIPGCWPSHPHLIHEIAVIADQRRRAGLAKNSDALEEWHRYCLPAFSDRMRNRIRAHCEDKHGRWPGKPRHSEHLSQDATEKREDAFARDVDALQAAQRGQALGQPLPRPRLVEVDLESGEIHGHDE
ncbi:MAG: hypothetical protein L0H74_04030 [Brachybacterium sp.]|nr:hypothetical protein [Brachybacterium sp.]